jgi:hypothetical protein
MDREFLSLSPSLRLVSKYTIGVDDVDVDAASALGVLVTHCPTEANWGGVAEGALALMLTVLKRVRERDRHVKAGGWRDPPIYGTYVGKRADGYAGSRSASSVWGVPAGASPTCCGHGARACSRPIRISRPASSRAMASSARISTRCCASPTS